MAKLVIGLVGEKGGGKGKFTELIKEWAKIVTCKFPTVKSTRFSDVLNDILKILSVSPSRENLQKLVLNLKNAYGPDILTNAVHNRVLNEESDIVILDGIRWPTDEQMLRKFPNNILVYITADAKIRYERTKIRGEKAGESEASFEQFQKEEQVETEIFIPQIGSRADIKIRNNGTIEEFEDEIRNFYEQFIKKALR